jgi:hypothetical protein
MSNEDTRKSAAHEQLNDIADKLATSAAAGSGDVQPSPYVSRQQPAQTQAATSADPVVAAAAAEPGSKPIEPPRRSDRPPPTSRHRWSSQSPNRRCAAC